MQAFEFDLTKTNEEIRLALEENLMQEQPECERACVRAHVKKVTQWLECPANQHQRVIGLGCMFCLHGHMTDCHYPKTCSQARCSHYLELQLLEAQEAQLLNNNKPMEPTKESNFDLPMTDAAKAAINDPKKWRTCSPDHVPCAVCQRMIFSMPIRMWKEMGRDTQEIAFHISCVFPDQPDNEISPEQKEYGSCVCIICEHVRTCPHVCDEERKRFIDIKTEIERESSMDQIIKTSRKMEQL